MSAIPLPAEDPSVLAPSEKNLSGYFFYLLWGGAHPQHMEVPRLGVELGLQLPAYTTPTETPDLS